MIISNDTMTLIYVKGYISDMTSAKLDVNQFKHMFSNLIDFLLTTPRDKLPSQSTRNNIVDSLTEYYFKEQGEYPEPYLLEQLANYCLLDYIKSVNKKKSDKNRFLTKQQLSRREMREYLVDNNNTLLDYLYSKHVLKLDSLMKVNKLEIE